METFPPLLKNVFLTMLKKSYQKIQSDKSDSNKQIYCSTKLDIKGVTHTRFSSITFTQHRYYYKT